ncbi:MAG TPA: tetratricopeptide repeat protein [bacterium]|nr:tetratricopeptide repeat protein [bacterium]
MGAGEVLGATAEDYYQAGLRLYLQKDYKKSLPYLGEALRLDPRDWKASQTLGQAYYLLGDKAMALAMMDQSLKLHPDNPTLRNFVERIRAQNLSAGAPTATATPEAEGPPLPSLSSLDTRFGKATINPVLEKNRVFTRISGGLYSGLFDDLSSSSSYFAAQTSTAMKHDLGSYLRTEIAYSVNRNLALGLGAEQAWAGQFLWTASNHSLKIAPQLFSIFAVDDNCWPDSAGRWYVQVAFGFDFATVQYDLEPLNGATFPVYAGSMAGSAFGASCTLGREFMLLDILGVDLNAGFRYASIQKVTGDNSQAGGTVTFGVDGYKNILLLPVTAVESGQARYAEMDFSGFDLGGAIELDFD